MEAMNKWKDEEGLWWVQVMCPTCGEPQVMRRSNSYKFKECQRCTNDRRSRRMTQHGLYSRTLPNPELRRCADKVKWMTLRSYSEKHPTYLGICQGLDVKRQGEYKAALHLQNVLGTPPPDTSIEKWGQHYHCGQCDECKANGWENTLLGYIPLEEQKYTRSNTCVFRKGNERVCLNRLSELIDVPQTSIDYLYYRKFKDIKNTNDRWFAVRNHLITNSTCPECLRVILERN